MKTVYIGLGSNVGDRAATIERGMDALNDAGVRIVKKSSLYETEPVDAPPQQWFLNAVVEAQTELMPQQLLRAIGKIEKAFGRQRIVQRGPRTLDLDILLYGSSVVHARELEVPHPRLPLRQFVLVPLVEIAPALRHPSLDRSMTELLAATADTSQVRRWRSPRRTRNVKRGAGKKKRKSGKMRG
jgi:2-amino-4-hydroxy-6-hydroxymethyldihydropteridine diphosphokinase